MDDRKLGRDRWHRYTTDRRPPVKLKKDGTPYANQPKPKHTLPSVTTITGQLEKRGLTWGASKVAAQMAVKQPHRWQGFDESTAIELIRTEFDRVWGIKREIGSITHEAALAASELRSYDPWEPFNALPTIAEDIDEMTAKLTGHLGALNRFLVEQDPEITAAEQTVLCVDAQPHGGCFDARGHLKLFGSADVMWDYKTGTPYLAETTIQLAGYSLATHNATFDEDGWLDEMTAINPPEKYVGVWLADDGTYYLEELPITEAATSTFNALKSAWYARRDVEAWAKSVDAQAF